MDSGLGTLTPPTTREAKLYLRETLKILLEYKVLWLHRLDGAVTQLFGPVKCSGLDGWPSVGDKHEWHCAPAFRRKSSGGAGDSDSTDPAGVSTARPCSQHLTAVTSFSWLSNPTR